MKKVGKEFRKSLSAILAAAMVVSSMPETSLVANAEEVDAKQEAVDLGDYAEVGANESTDVKDSTILKVVTTVGGEAITGVTAEATTVESDSDGNVYVRELSLSGDKAGNYRLLSVGGAISETEDDFTGYIVPDDKVADDGTIEVLVEQTACELNVTNDNEGVEPVFKACKAPSELTEKTAKALIKDSSVTEIENFESIEKDTNVLIQVPAGYQVKNGETMLGKVEVGNDTEDFVSDYYYLTLSEDTTIVVESINYDTTVTTKGKGTVTEVKYKINDGTAKGLTEENKIPAKKGDTVTLELTYDANVVVSVEAVESTTDKDAVAVTESADKKTFTYHVGTKPIALTITANNKKAITFTANKDETASATWDNTKATGVKYGTDLNNVTTSLTSAVITDSADDTKDMAYFAIDTKETVKSVKIVPSTGEPLVLEQYKANVFGRKAADLIDGAIQITNDAAEKNAMLTANIGTGLKAYYSTTATTADTPETTGIVDNGFAETIDGKTYNWIEITGSTIDFATENTNVYIKVVADDKKMISTSKINSATTATRESARTTERVYTVPLTTANGKSTGAFEATAEDLATEYTFTWSKNYTTKILAGSYSNYSQTIDGKASDIDTNTADITLDGTDSKITSQTVKVRVKDGQKIKFTVVPTDKTKNEIKSVTVTGEDDSLAAISDGSIEYYTFTGKEIAEGGTVTIDCDTITRKTLTLTINETNRDKLEKIKVYINKNPLDGDKYGKVEHTTGNYHEITSGFDNISGIMVYPGQDVEIEFQTKNGYSVNAIKYELDGVKYSASGNKFTYTSMKDDKELEIVVGEDAAKLNKAEFTYDSKVVTITTTDTTVPATPSSTDPLKAITMVPADAVANNFTQFDVRVKDGYEIESITVGGEEIELGTSDTPITSKTGIKVDFGKEEKTVNGTTTEVSKSGQAVAVVVKAKAVKNEKDRLFTIDSSAFAYTDENGKAKNYAVVSVPSQTGVSSYKRNNVTYYDVNAETTDEIEFTVQVPAMYTADIDTDNTAKADAVYLAGSETSGGNTTYTFKVIASKLTEVSVDAAGEVITDADEIKLAKSDAATISIEKGASSYDYDMFCKDEDGKLVPVSSIVQNGTEVYFVYKPYLTLYRNQKDALKNDDDEKIAVSYTVDGSLYENDEKAFNGYNVSKVTISSDLAKKNSVTFSTKNDKLGDYKVWAEVSGDDSLEGDFENDETGILTSATAKAGNTVKIFVKSDKRFTIKDVELTDEQKKLYNVTVNDTTKALEVSLTSKATDTITIPVVVTESNGSKKSEIEIENFTINVAPAKSTVKVEGVEDKGTIEILAGKKTELPITFAAGTPVELIDVQSGSAVKADLNKKGDKLVLDATASKVDQTQTITIRYDSKSVFSFTAKVVAPELKVTATSANTGDTYVNLTMDPSLKLASWDDAPAYYEVKVTPGTGTGTMPAGSKTGYYYIPLNDLGYDDDDDTLEYGADSFVIPVNTAGGAWNYTVDVKLVLASSNITTGLDIKNMKTSAQSVCAASEAVSLALATKDTYYEDNLSVKQLTKTVYTGQTVDIASVNYSDSASRVSYVEWEIVDADGARKTNGWSDTSDGFMDITVPSCITAGKYTVNVYAESEYEKQVNKDHKELQGMIRSKASFNVNVKYGISEIVLDNSENTDTLSLAQTGAKDVSYTFKPVGYYNYVKEGDKNNKKSAIQKFTYKVESATATNKDNISISAKGKLTVSKNYAFSANEAYNKATVTITAADYEGNVTEKKVTVTIKNEKAIVDSISLVANGKDLGTALTYDQTIKGVQLVVKDKDGNDITKNVTITPVKGSAYVQDGKLYTLENKAPKSVTIKATTKDGGKKSKSLKVKLGYNTEATLTAEVRNTNAVESTPNNWSVQTKGRLVYVDIYAGGALADKSIYNWSVSSVKGGKVISTCGDKDTVAINPTSDKITFTLTDKTKKPVVKTNVTVAVTDYANAKAPKFSLNKGDKLYANIGGYWNDDTERYEYPTIQKLRYTVKSDEYNAVQITWLSGTKETNAGIQTGIIPIKDGQFELVSNYTSKKAGTHKYQAVFGNIDATTGAFIPATKAANFSIKMSKQTKVTPVTEYTLNYKNTNKVEFVDSTGVYNVRVNYLENDNVKGKSNNFATYFTKDGNNIVLRDDIYGHGVLKKFDEIASIPAEDLTGYVNYTYNTWNGPVTTSVKIKINLVSEAVNYSFESIPVVSNSTVYADVLATDDKGNYITIDTSKNPVSETAGWTVQNVEDITVGGKDVTKITLRSTAAVVGDNAVSIKVVPLNTVANQFNAVSVDKNGISLAGKVKVLDAESVSGLLKQKVGVTVDFDSDLSTQSYNDATKKGTYTTYVPLEDIFENVDADGVIDPLSISNGEKVVNVTTTSKAKVSVATLEGVSCLKVVAEEADVTGMTSIPLTFTFNHAKSGQAVNLAVTSPKIYDVNGMKAVIESELASYPYDSDTDANNKVNALLRKYAGSGIELTTALTSTHEGDNYTLTGKIKHKGSDATADISAVMNTKTIHKEKLDVDLMGTILADIKSESFKDSAEYKAEGFDTSSVYVVSQSTTQYDVLSFINNRLKVYTTDSDEYTYKITYFEKEAPSNYENGSIEFTVTTYKNGKYQFDNTRTGVCTNYLKYKVNEQ